MRNSLLLALVAISLLMSISEAAAATRLFILSGQSNMAGLDPDVSFTPALKAAFPNDTIIVVKEAVNGQPIRKWCKQWKAADGTSGPEPGSNGRIYNKLMAKVGDALKDQPSPDSVTFVWMQGEADAKEGGDVYAASLKALIAQVRGDLKRQDVMVILGRISDFSDPENPRPFWDKIRAIQVETAEGDPLAAWVDTDDLNGPTNTLHYNKAGYKTLGERFARKSIELINKQPKAK